MIKVIDHEPQWWFLVEENGSLFLDVSCDHSFVGYNFSLQLNEEELKAYTCEGRAFISRLATAIQDSVPILTVSISAFKSRKLSQNRSNDVTKAIESWQAHT